MSQGSNQYIPTIHSEWPRVQVLQSRSHRKTKERGLKDVGCWALHVTECEEQVGYRKEAVKFRCSYTRENRAGADIGLSARMLANLAEDAAELCRHGQDDWFPPVAAGSWALVSSLSPCSWVDVLPIALMTFYFLTSALSQRLPSSSLSTNTWPCFLPEKIKSTASERRQDLLFSSLFMVAKVPSSLPISRLTFLHRRLGSLWVGSLWSPPEQGSTACPSTSLSSPV